MGRCNYRHNMWCNCKKPTKKLMSYEEIMAMSREDRITALNKAPIEYYEKFYAEGKIDDTHNVPYLVDDSYTQWSETFQEWVEGSK